MKKYIWTILIITTVTSLTYAQTTDKTTIEIKGFGKVTTLPDLGFLNIEVTTTHLLFNKTISELNTKTDKIYKQLEKVGFKKESIKTDNFRVQPNRVYDRQKSYDSGYVGTQIIVAEFENTKDKISQIINSFIDGAADAQFNFSFGISDKRRTELRNDLVKLAINDAYTLVKLMTETTGRQIDKMVDIKYGTFENHNLFGFGGLNEIVPITMQEAQTFVGFEVKELSFSDYVIIKWTLK
ncbi:MAG: SIMPL domain-containing protein [Cyclobacteriaceae bacterium]|jgi:uncharacterized protein YggE|nr:SIMPL domain-containing protein [Cyclobacteriaceae bacterium]